MTALHSGSVLDWSLLQFEAFALRLIKQSRRVAHNDQRCRVAVRPLKNLGSYDGPAGRCETAWRPLRVCETRTFRLKILLCGGTRDGGVPLDAGGLMGATGDAVC